MYCLWEQFGLVDDKRELSLNGMLTFFQRIPAYRAEVEKAISECKGIGNYLGIYCPFSFPFVPLDRLRVLETYEIWKTREKYGKYEIIRYLTDRLIRFALSPSS